MSLAKTAEKIDRRMVMAEQFETPIAQSWRRSVNTHRLDPGRTVQPCVLPSHNLRDYQVPLEHFIHTARSGQLARGCFGAKPKAAVAPGALTLTP